MRSVGLAQVALGRMRSLWPLARPGEECGGSCRSDNRGGPRISREGLLVGRGWGRQEMGCTHSLSCSVPF
ncbi:hypothetical protein T484DRAFT_1941858, partial [Baffinella frigidus]